MHVSPPNTHYNFQRTPRLANDAPITHNRFGNGSSHQSNSSCPVDYTYLAHTSPPPVKPVCTAPLYSRTNTGTFFNTQQECKDSGSHGAKTNGCELIYGRNGSGYLPKCDKGYYGQVITMVKDHMLLIHFIVIKIALLTGLVWIIIIIVFQINFFY